MEFGRILKSGLVEWLKEPRLVRLFVIIFAVYFVSSLLTTAFMAASFGLDLSWQMIKSEWEVIPNDENWAEDLTGDAFVSRAVLFGLAGLLIGIAVLIVATMISAFAVHESMIWKRIRTGTISIAKSLKFVVFNFYACIVILLLLMDPIWLVVRVISMVLIAVGLLFGGLALVLLVLGFLGLLAYAGIVIYHIYRLSFADIAWLSSEMPMQDALEESWQATKGRFWEIFIGAFGANIVSALLAGGVVSILALAPMMIGDASQSPAVIAICMGVLNLLRAVMTSFLFMASFAIIAEIYVQVLRDPKKH